MNELHGQLVLPRLVPAMSEDSCDIKYGTKASWEANDEVSRIRTLYVYTDYLEVDEGSFLPALKIGDGKSLLSDLPFFFSSAQSETTPIDLTPELEERIEEILRTKIGLDENLEQTIARILREKVSVTIDSEDPEQFVFVTG